MMLRVQRTIKINVTLVLNVHLSLNKGTLAIYKRNKRIGSITSTIVMGNEEISVICKILHMIDILMSIFPPLILEEVSLIIKVMNILRKKGESQIMIYLIQSMLKFQNIKSKM